MIFPTEQTVLRHLWFSGLFPKWSNPAGFPGFSQGESRGFTWILPGLSLVPSLPPGPCFQGITRGKPGGNLVPRFSPGKLTFTRGGEFIFPADSAGLESWCFPGKDLGFLGITTKTRDLPGFPARTASKILSPSLADLNSNRECMLYPGFHQARSRFPHG